MFTFGIALINLNLHPLLVITFAYILGIVSYVTEWYSITPLFLLLIFCSWFFTNLYHKFLLFFLLILFFTLGFYRITTSIKNHGQSYQELTEKNLQIIGTVADISPNEHPLYKQKIAITCHKLRTIDAPDARWKPRDLNIMLYTPRQDNLFVDDILFIDKIYCKKISNDGFIWYLIKEGIITTLFLNNFSYELLTRPTISLSRELYNLRETTLGSLQKKMKRKTFQLFASIFLGNKPAPKEQLEASKDHFNTWGVMHYLARSGLHMVIFVLVWQFLLNFIPISFSVKQWLLILLCLLYCLLSWASISFTRAVFSFLVYRLAILARFQTNFLHILTLVCFAILLHNPLQLFFLDFQLSFGLTFALALFTHIQTAAKYNY